MGERSFVRNRPSNKIKSLSEIAKITHHFREHNKTVGLITGCFDILHIGHIQLFRFAKNHVDIVVVGVENDRRITLSKGSDRPIHNLNQRCTVLSELASIDYVFAIDKVMNFNADSDEASKFYTEVCRMIKPAYLITNPGADKYWKEKEVRAKEVGAKLLKRAIKRVSSTSLIVQKLESEF